MTSLLACAALALTQQTPTESKIVGASLFKNGYALVMREIPVTGDTTTLQKIPNASLGTFWISSSDGAAIKEVTNTLVESKSERSIVGFGEMLARNVGKDVELTTLNLGVQRGTILALNGDTLVLKSETTRMFQIGEIRMISFAADPVLKTPLTTYDRALRFKTTGRGKILLLGLERGMTWMPGYGVELNDDKTLRLSAKATILNDLEDFAGIDLRFVTGFPNVPWATVAEPLLSAQSVDQFTNFLSSVGAGGPGGIGGGGFGKGRELMSQNMAPGAAQDFDAGFGVTGSAEQMSEDLFFYKQPNMTMKRGDRSMVMLFDIKAPYEQVFVCTLPSSISPNGDRFGGGDKSANDVWNTLKFTNSSGQPLTTATLTVFKNNQVLGQDTLLYTSTGAKATIRMSKALDIRVESEEEELKRETGILRMPNGTMFDLVTLKGTVVIKNRKAETAKLSITKVVSGEVLTVDGNAKSTKLASGLREINPTTELKWEPSVDSTKELTFTYTYKLYLRSY